MRIFISLVFVVLSFTAYAQLPVPSNLIALSSDKGETLFHESQYKKDYWRLSEFFTTEVGLSWCGVASDVMVLNAI